VSTPLFGVVGFFCLGEGEEKEQVCGQFEPNWAWEQTVTWRSPPLRHAMSSEGTILR